jgi:diguanylate cyclase (GGDEF)-like protein
MDERTSDSHARTVKTLVARIAELELARAVAADESRRLLAVAEATKHIAATRDVDGIVTQLLRAIRDPLGFGRAMYFTVDRARGIEPHAQLDGSDAIEPCREELDLGPGSTVLAVLRGEPDGFGVDGELSAPIVDVRRWYVVCALAGNDGTIGLLYADGHRTETADETIADHVRSVASVAAIAIENATHIAQTQALAARDSLTGLYNRRAFEERLLQTMIEAERAQRSFAYVMIDVDDFKSINDRFGHAHGDDVLRSVAATLTASSRAEDVVGRYAGDEFAVIIVNIEPSLARTLVARLSGDLRARGLSCSLGAALFPHDARHARSLMEAADRALYDTKAAGKDGFSFFVAPTSSR